MRLGIDIVLTDLFYAFCDGHDVPPEIGENVIYGMGKGLLQE
jgi:hypothetical protein